ncbi:MAG: PEP-CTERM sorting domain-containing protein [Thermoguttaceae bacterium]|nr:PEP-CTERM sorting domain-containing protein [Thermoguttaceae bacterium]
MFRKMIMMGMVASLLMVASAQAATVDVTSVFNSAASTGDVGYADGHAWINDVGGSAVFDVYMTFDQSYTNVTALEFLGTFAVDVSDYYAQGGVGSAWSQADFVWDGTGAFGNMDTQFSVSPTVAASLTGTSEVQSFITGDIVAGQTYKLGTMTVNALSEVSDPNQIWNMVFGFSQTYAGFGITSAAGSEIASLVQNPSNSTVAIPEPGTYAMLCGLGLVGAAWYRRRKNAH